MKNSLTTNSGVINENASSTAYIDYVLNDGIDGTRAQASALQINSASGFELNLDYRAAKKIRIPVVCSVALGNISAVSAGLFYGQEMTITSKTSSTEDFTITNGGNFSIGTDLIVAPSEAYNFWWDGFDWVND